MRSTAFVWMAVSAFFAAICSAPVISAELEKPGPVDQKIVLIKGTQAWVSTGFVLGPKDKVTLTSAGEVCFQAGDPQSCTGPYGWPRSDFPTSWPDHFGECADPLESINHAMVIGRMGTGGIFPVGPSLTFTGKPGPLFLGINDCSFSGPKGNSGEYSVIVRVERGK